MVKNEVLKQKIVHEFEIDKYEQLFNKASEELQGKVTEIKEEVLNGELIAHFYYREEQIDESTMTVKDEFHLAGERYVCEQCPYMEQTDDKRVKRCKCKFAHYGMTRKDSECCELFYVRLANHEIEPVGC